MNAGRRVLKESFLMGTEKTSGRVVVPKVRNEGKWEETGAELVACRVAGRHPRDPDALVTRKPKKSE